MTLPLAQHIGAPAIPRVAKGDRVLAGQLVAEGAGFMSANIHASVSGTVTAVDAIVNAQGLSQKAIVIRRDGDEWAEGIDRPMPSCASAISRRPRSSPASARRASSAWAVRRFPTHVKLAVPPGKRVEYLIINGVECEPYLTSDHRVMLERGEGCSWALRSFGKPSAWIGRGSASRTTSLDAVAAARGAGGAACGHRDRAPAREISAGRREAAHRGRDGARGRRRPRCRSTWVRWCNASTALAVYEAVQKRKPLVERVVTVTGGGLREPKNLRVRLGTPVSALIEAAGGMPEGDVKAINGGPMMGRAVVRPEAPVTKRGCSGITILSGADAVRREASACIKCARCVAVRPMGLEPYLLSKRSRRKEWDIAEANDITSCIECGCCQATCPGICRCWTGSASANRPSWGASVRRATANGPKK